MQIQGVTTSAALESGTVFTIRCVSKIFTFLPVGQYSDEILVAPSRNWSNRDHVPVFTAGHEGASTDGVLEKIPTPVGS